MLPDRQHRETMMPSTVLFLAANPAVPELALGRECQTIEDRIRTARFRDQLRLRPRWAARPGDLLQALLEHEPVVLHFSGHGDGVRGLCFLDERGEIIHVSSDGLSQVIRAAGDCIKLVVLNACYTKVQAEALVAHVPCVIGMPHAIGDGAAIAYAANFYCAVAFGRSVANAHQCGLAALAVHSSGDIAVEDTRDLAAAEAALRREVPEMLTRPGVDARQIHIVPGAPATDSTSHAPADARVHVEITFDADMETFSEEALARTIGEVRRLTGARSVKIICVTKGSVKVTLSVDGVAAAKLRELRQDGRLDQMTGFAIKDVAGFEPIESYVDVRFVPPRAIEQEQGSSGLGSFDEVTPLRIAIRPRWGGRASHHLSARGRVGRFRLRASISDGFAQTYEAYDEQLDRRVMITVRPGLSELEAQRLAREARLLARLSHPNVAQLYEAGVDDGVGFFAMEFVAGVPLTRWLKSESALRTPRQLQREILRRFISAGRALEAAHAAGVVHGDFKPTNFWIRNDGRVCVTSFGVILSVPSSMSQGPATRGIAGTPRYMAPEQWRGECPDFCSDQFSFCVALYHALTGEFPFPGTTVSEIHAALKHGPVHIAGGARVPKRLELALRRGLSFEPSQRFASMGELLEQLEPRESRRHGRAAPWLAALFVVTGLAATGMVLMGVTPGEPLLASLAAVVLPAGMAAGYLLATRRTREGHNGSRERRPYDMTTNPDSRAKPRRKGSRRPRAAGGPQKVGPEEETTEQDPIDEGNDRRGSGARDLGR
jgi:hypothetical protein